MKKNFFKNFKENFSYSWQENQSLRLLRSFFHQKIFPILWKGFAALVALIVIILILIKIFKPLYLEKIYHKSQFYFFHYLNLDNQNFSLVKITGNNRASTKEIMAIVDYIKQDFLQSQIEKYDSESYEPLIKKMIVEIKKYSPWTNKVVITRSMPNVINIAITEYEPFAIWQDDGKKYVTDKDGNVVLVEDIEEFKNLIILSGKGANNHAKSLFNIFTIDSNLSARVYSATWLGGRRWDIRFDNGLLIKLPEDNISEAWHSLIKIYNMPGSVLGLNVIDLRIEGKIYLEYGDSVIKELKNL
jgi:cell division septal protein FtsQ